MAFKTIKRPKISLGERFYLQSILGGLWLTIRHLVLALLGKSRNKKELAGSDIGVTMQYPEARWDKHLPKYYRGAPVLVKGEDGFYYENDREDGFFGFMSSALILKDRDWFLDNVDTWLWYNSDDMPEPDMFSVEDAKEFFLSKRAEAV